MVPCSVQFILSVNAFLMQDQLSPWRALDDGRGEVAVAAHGAHAADQGRHEAAAPANAAPVALPALLTGLAGLAGRPWPPRIPGFTL